MKTFRVEWAAAVYVVVNTYIHTFIHRNTHTSLNIARMFVYKQIFLCKYETLRKHDI